MTDELEDLEDLYGKIYVLGEQLYRLVIHKYPTFNQDDESYLLYFINLVIDRSELIKDNKDVVKNLHELKIVFGILFFKLKITILYRGFKERSEPLLCQMYESIQKMRTLVCVENVTQ